MRSGEATIRVSDQRLIVDEPRGAWKTAERDAQGNPRYPDGDYEIVVRAWDYAGNVASVTDTVRVRN